MQRYIYAENMQTNMRIKSYVYITGLPKQV